MAVKSLAVAEAIPGCVLADAVLNFKGNVLLGKGITLTPRHIALLNSWEVSHILVAGEEETLPSSDSQHSKQESRFTTAYQKFTEEYSAMLTVVSRHFDFIRRQKSIPVPHFSDLAHVIHGSVSAKGAASLEYLLMPQGKLTDYISHHSMMVAFLAGVIARQLGWDEKDSRQVALAGLLHDVGSLTASARFETKTTGSIAETAALLRAAEGVPREVVLGIIQHRERMDGTGFPTGALADKIHPYARVIGIADLFHTQAYGDNTTNPFLGLKLLMHGMFSKLDMVICQAFVQHLQDAMLHHTILLSNGRRAEIIFFPPVGTYLPIVRTEDNQIIDLGQCHSFHVAGILSS